MLCPNGFVASEGICRPFISKLLKHEYFVQLQLTPSSDQLPPRSYLVDLTDEQRIEPETWLDAKGAPLDAFALYSKTVNINDTEYAEELVVKIGKENYPLNLSREIKNIETAIAEPWTLRLKGKVFQYFVQFYRYLEFVPSAQRRQKENVLNHITLSGEALSYEYSSPDEFYDNDVFSRMTAPYPLKKTNFCKRVRLKRFEWMAGFNEIRLNISKEVFGSDKRLGDSEFDLFLDEMGEPTVEICVEDFNPDYHEQQATAASSGMMVTASVLFNSRILIFTMYRMTY